MMADSLRPQLGSLITGPVTVITTWGGGADRVSLSKTGPFVSILGSTLIGGAATAAELNQLTTGQTVRVVGIVTHRQRPEPASGVVCMILENETGISNLIIWSTIQQQQREAVFGARLLVVEGGLQNELNVIHVVARRYKDYVLVGPDCN
jgi:error-prone DNA polymerase